MRQVYSNALGIDRDLLTALLAGTLSVLALAGFLRRLQRQGSRYLLVDAVTVSQALLAGLGILAYSVYARISAAEAVSSFYYYCLAPFLIYAGFLLCRLEEVNIRAGLIAMALAYAVTFGLGIAQMFGVDSGLLEYERGFVQHTSEGFARANGLYGTQIDFGCLSFFVFTVAFYLNRSRAGWLTKTTMALAILGALTSMSRVAVAAICAVVGVELLFRGSLKTRLKHLVLVSLVIAVIYPLADSIGATGTLMSEDPYTKDSNQTRIGYLVATPRLMLERYPLVGEGPGSQNGPGGPGGSSEKVATDFLWLGILVDFGALAGAILILLRLVLLVYLLLRAYMSRGGKANSRITTALTMMFLLASCVDSAYAHPVTISIFYIIVGIFLYQDAMTRIKTQPSMVQA